jgi:hypothetical protein
MGAPSIHRGTPRTGGGPARGQVAQTYALQAPTGGLNAVNALAAMPETDAIVMDNFFPQPSYVQLRSGYGNWATGLPGWVETLMGYSNAAGEKLFAISGGKIYDATLQGAIGAPVVTGLTNSRWEYTNVATAGGQFLYAANAADPPQLYSGTAWTAITAVSTPAITGVVTTLLRNPTVWKNRVWFVEDGSMRAWYLPTASIGGAALPFDFGAIFRLGGKLQSIMTASLTDGSTFDEYICFMSTEGEIALYRGTDPSQVGMFVLQGIYRVGKPVGRRCWFKYGADTIVICSDGYVSLTKLISIGRVNTEEAISYKIQMLVNNDVQAYGNNFGWEGVVSPLGNKMILNVPQNENSVQYQYVMNTLNNSWCTFGRFASPWLAATFCVLGNNLFFGGSNYVALADTGQSDNGNNITGLLKTAFSYFNSNVQKMVVAARPIILADGTISPTIYVNVDFQDVHAATAPTTLPSTGSAWNLAPWNVSSWAVGLDVQKGWQTVGGVGFTVSLYFSVSTKSSQVQIQSIDYLYQLGGIIG